MHIIQWDLLAGALGLMSYQTRYFSSVTILAAYLVHEIAMLRSMHTLRWLINPVVQTSFGFFFMGFVVPNILYFMPYETLAMLGMPTDITPWMDKLLWLVLLAAVALWIGYWSSLTSSLRRALNRSAFRRQVMRTDFNVRPLALVVLVALSLMGRLAAIRLHVYGYSSDLQSLAGAASLTQYLTIAGDLGRIALLLASLQYFSRTRVQGGSLVSMLGILGYELLFGFLSGFKAGVVTPVFVVGACYYFCRDRIPWTMVIVVPATIFAAYAVIEPFRVARDHDATFDGTSFWSIAETTIKSASGAASAGNESDLPDSGPGTTEKFLSRVDFTYVASLGIEFADTQPLPPDSPNFLGDIFLAPFYAVVPRFMWESKEMSRHGQWYTWVVLRKPEDLNTAVGMSPVTYLYFAGGAIAVLIGFFFVGAVQRFFTERFLFRSSGNEALIFMLMWSVIANVDSIYYSYIINAIRGFFGALLLQYLVLYPPTNQPRGFRINKSALASDLTDGTLPSSLIRSG